MSIYLSGEYLVLVLMCAFCMYRVLNEVEIRIQGLLPLETNLNGKHILLCQGLRDAT